jgi:hypothetical protein
LPKRKIKKNNNNKSFSTEHTGSRFSVNYFSLGPLSADLRTVTKLLASTAEIQQYLLKILGTSDFAHHDCMFTVLMSLEEGLKEKVIKETNKGSFVSGALVKDGPRKQYVWRGRLLSWDLYNRLSWLYKVYQRFDRIYTRIGT